ncbi:histone-lysine N-methyltransferase SETD5 isoform X2 [Epinephelus fuscoguttatus]|uniref:histone-lysine N-methyltransferase SETD5 isoform X2 n=1 Tax=Epinephelus fuscoguttatus TaxID=293821 RepID=UPI0020D0F639|nr:histone-lysine N-methyltransferase SETD5 isoform X2 [Epinephelus fuscoguttatus]
MSIVIALGVTTPETSYSDMAAGSDPESVEASPAVNEKNYNNHSCGSAQSHGYRGLPYADHNYGAPPPPTPPASPLSQTIIPRMDLNGMVRGARYHETTEDNSADSDSSSEEDGAVASWCHCSLTPDGLLIKCDNCRGLDRRKGAKGQHRKTENVSAGESSATESGDEEVSPSTISYTATQHTPTSIKLTVNRVKRSKSKKRKKSTEKARGTPKGKKVKAFREGSRKSMRMKNSTTEASVLDENTAEGWESRIRQWTDQYEEALANQYSADIQTLLQLHRAASTTVSKAESGTATPPSTTQIHASVDAMDTINRTELACNNTVLGSQMQLQLGRVTRVQKHRKILRAAKNLEADTLIIEYRGKVMLKQQFEVNGHFFKKPYPFVLFYSKFNDVEMCVDARTFGNDARFIRRSCTPNAEVRHMIAEGMIHLCIYAVSQITKDAEVTIGFDYEFNSCNYKVDCACHKGNQNCPVQKHNLSPRESLLSTPSLPPPSPLVGAETRRRKARRRELESCHAGDSNQTLDQHQEAKELQGTSDTEERLLDELKVEEGEEGEVDENGVAISSKRNCNSLERRRRRVGGAEVKEEGVESEDGAGNPSGNTPIPHNTGVGVSTRRTTYVMEAPSIEEKTLLPNLPAPTAPPKPARPTKPRPKSRISRYRSSSSQRARRQRQALAQQAAAAAAAAAMAATPSSADQGASLDEEGSQGPYGAEHGHGESGPGGHLLEGEGQGLNCINRGNMRYPKTKKYLVTEWLNDKVPGGEKVHQEVPIERPLRITTDPTVLATTLNMLPGLSHSSLICTTPRHYVRFGSPFNPERRRPRPLQMDGTYGCYKKRWIKQVEDESCSASVEDGTESTSSQQSTSSRSTPNPLSSEINAPFKKRRSKYMPETTPVPSDHLLRPLSPITPPLPEDSLHPPFHTPCGSLLPNGLAYSPMPSLPASRCNTPLQFENISSPEASPVHRPESISPEPCLQTDFDIPRPQFPDLSLPSSLESPVAVTSDDFSLPGGPSGHDSQGTSSVGTSSLNPVSCPSSDLTSQNREQAFRTEFNLIYTCSPLNANLGNPVATERHLSQSEGGFSPAESFHSSISGQGLLGDVGPGSMSPYGEPHYGGGYPDSGTPPHTSNPPQKKKRANQHTISLLTGKPDYQAIAVRSEYKPVQNMVSLLEYRKRKQGSGRDSEPAASSSSLSSTPTRPGSHYSQDSHHPHCHQQMQPQVSPHSSFSSSAHSSSIPQIEEVSPPDHQGSSAHSRRQDNNNQWMVPTTVERLREGQGVRERVLRSIKMERIYKRSDGSTEKESDADRYEMQAVSMASPMKSPHRYSPSVYSHQSSESHRQTDSPSFLQQTSNSPFRGNYSPSSGQSFYPRLSTSHPGVSQDHPPSSYHSHTPTSTSSSDSRPSAGSLHQQSGSSNVDGGHGYSSSHLKANLLNSSGLPGTPNPGPRAHGQTKIDLGAQASRGGQQQASRSLKSGSPGQVALQAGSRLLSATGPTHYPQRGTSLSQFQHSPLQGPGVRTQSGSF